MSMHKVSLFYLGKTYWQHKAKQQAYQIQTGLHRGIYCFINFNVSSSPHSFFI